MGTALSTPSFSEGRVSGRLHLRLREAVVVADALRRKWSRTGPRRVEKAEVTQRIELRALRSNAARKDFAIAGVPGEGNAPSGEVLQGHRCVPEGILRHRAAHHPPQFIHPRPRLSQLCRAAQARVEPLRVAIPTLVVNAPAGRA